MVRTAADNGGSTETWQTSADDRAQDLAPESGLSRHLSASHGPPMTSLPRLLLTLGESDRQNAFKRFPGKLRKSERSEHPWGESALGSNPEQVARPEAYELERKFEIVYQNVITPGLNANVITFSAGVTNTTDVIRSFNSCLDAALLNSTSGLTEVQNTTLPHPKNYSLLFMVVASALSSVIFVFGFLGNILVVVVIARTRSMHTTTNCYLLSLAVADSIVLLAGTLPAIPEPFFKVDEWPYGRLMCPLLIFLQYLGVDSSSLSITAFTIERYIAICHPMKAHTMCTVSRAKKIIAILWIFTLLYCSPWLGLIDVLTHTRDATPIKTCKFRLDRSSYTTLYMIDLILFYVIPLIIATVLYLLIGRILYLSKSIRKNDRLPKHRSPKRRADSRVQVVRMLIVVVASFASLWLPYRAAVVYNSFALKKYTDMWFLLFARTMIYVNCAINPVLYNIMSVKFKRAFRNHLNCCNRRDSMPATNSTEVGTDVWATRRQTVSLQQQNQLAQYHRYSISNRLAYNNGNKVVSPSHVSGGVTSGSHSYQHLLQSSYQQDGLSSPRLHKMHTGFSSDTAEQSV
ncbi:thyrotropin-releasing hormone receptor-like [Physella acuta]|uniref:thyrotropin-releasing hormone receptor-like n=1 Tax=Physella acuta TaxID=109671 RepID=UPI0027DB4E86|nr:thyrotropin-releasing hormone receptor-like [Physella acuta]